MQSTTVEPIELIPPVEPSIEVQLKPTNVENCSQGYELQAVADMTANVFEPIRELTTARKRAAGEIRKVIESNRTVIEAAHALFSAQGRRVPVDGQPTWSEWLRKNLTCSKRYVDKVLNLPKPVPEPKLLTQEERYRKLHAAVQHIYTPAQRNEELAEHFDRLIKEFV